MDAAASGRDVVVTNPGYLLGPEDHQRSVMGRFCKRYWKGRIPIAPPGGFNLVDVRDAARGHLLAAERGLTGRRYILGGENRTFPEFMALLAEVGGMSPRAIPSIPPWTMSALARFCEALRDAHRQGAISLAPALAPESLSLVLSVGPGCAGTRLPVPPARLLPGRHLPLAPRALATLLRRHQTLVDPARRLRPQGRMNPGRPRRLTATLGRS